MKREEIARYLSALLGVRVIVVALHVLGGSNEGGDIKSYGYPTPVRVDYQIAGSERKSVVLHTMSPGPFGHEHMADRAQELIWENQAFNHLPRHIRSLDVSGFRQDGRLIALGNVEEFCLLTECAEGESYAHDLGRLRDNDALTELDLARADALCDYLVEIHKVPGTNPGLYCGASANEWGTASASWA